MSELLLDAAGRRRSPATLPEFQSGRPPRNKGMRYPADPPTIEEIVTVMRHARDGVHRRRLRGLAFVDKVDPHTVDLAAEVRELVQPPLLQAPVEPVSPVSEEPAHIGEVGALLPPRLGRRRRPARVADPLAQIGQRPLGNLNLEGLDVKRRHTAQISAASPRLRFAGPRKRCGRRRDCCFSATSRSVPRSCGHVENAFPGRARTETSMGSSSAWLAAPILGTCSTP